MKLANAFKWTDPDARVLVPLGDRKMFSDVARAKRIGFAHWVAIELNTFFFELLNASNEVFQNNAPNYLVSEISEEDKNQDVIGIRIETFSSNHICDVVLEYFTPEEATPETQIARFGYDCHDYFLRVIVKSAAGEHYRVVVGFAHQCNNGNVERLGDHLYMRAIEELFEAARKIYEA